MLSKKKSQIGVYGLGVMGRNLALNLEKNGFKVSVYNRTTEGEEHVTIDFLQNEAWNKNITGFEAIADFTGSLADPGIILLMVPAGKAVDEVIGKLQPILNEGAIIIDGGNSNFEDTERRVSELANEGLRFIGMGVSGGEEGALNGPSLMPGGNPDAWNDVKPFLMKIAAKNPAGEPCCEWMGEGGAGHFVKMVHNGIEYADMQILAESYHFMRDLLGYSYDKMAALFEEWNRGIMNGYLTEITAEIMHAKDSDNKPLLEKILDVADQKGTGKWTSIHALELSVPLPATTSAVISRFISGYVSTRRDTHERFGSSGFDKLPHSDTVIENLKQAITASRIMSLSEGFFLIRQAALQNGWKINLSAVAKIWQGGCIIRSELMKQAESSFLKEDSIDHLFTSASFAGQLKNNSEGWRDTVSLAVLKGLPVPAMSGALAHFDSLRCGKLPLNLVQAQRDYFGAHTYERVDKDRGEFFHTEWGKLK
jgi:6-phosphogluconate dehydrogenase